MDGLPGTKPIMRPLSGASPPQRLQVSQMLPCQLLRLLHVRQVRCSICSENFPFETIKFNRKNEKYSTNKSKTYGSFRLSHPSHGQTGGSKDPCPDDMPTLEMDSGDITDAIAKAEQANLEQMSKD